MMLEVELDELVSKGVVSEERAAALRAEGAGEARVKMTLGGLFELIGWWENGESARAGKRQQRRRRQRQAKGVKRQ